MPRGGWRPGSGRKPGVPDKLKEARQVMERHAEVMATVVRPEIAMMTPKDVMLRAMSLEANAGRWPQAAALAEKVAPYLHPRLSSVEMNATVKRTATDFNDADLAALAGEDGGEDGVDQASFSTH